MKLTYHDDEVFRKDAFEALSSQFKGYKEFEEFCSDLNDENLINDFIRVGTQYLFLVKKGDWHVNIERSNEVISYFTNSFKLVSALAIVESLSDIRYIDYFQWLNKKSNKHLFPINDRAELERHYRSYKKEHGAIKNVKSFFESLPEGTKQKLCKLITINGKKVPEISKVVDLIYQARSNFVHESKYMLEIGSGFHFAGTKKKPIVWRSFKIEHLLEAIEEGLVIFFRNCKLN